MSWKTFILSFISPQTLTISSSPQNGEILAQKYFGKNRLVVDGLTQSGEYVADLLGKAIDRLSLTDVKNILILGLGGGSVGREINRRFPTVQIKGVEIDSEMIRLGKKFLDLDLIKNLTVVTDDAISAVQKMAKNELFDIILIDLYSGYEVPSTSESPEFIRQVLSHLHHGGVLICNRLYFKQHKPITDVFVSQLKAQVSRVETKKYLANLLIYVYS